MTKNDINKRFLYILGSSRGQFYSLMFGAKSNSQEIGAISNNQETTYTCKSHSCFDIYDHAADPIQLKESISLASAVRLPSGSYIPNKNTIQHFKNGKVELMDTQIPGDSFQWGCAVARSETELVLIGGLSSKSRVISFDVKSKRWTSHGSLKVPR